MSSTGWHLAAFNIAKTKYDIADPRMVDFVNNLDPIPIPATSRRDGYGATRPIAVTRWTNESSTTRVLP